MIKSVASGWKFVLMFHENWDIRKERKRCHLRQLLESPRFSRGNSASIRKEVVTFVRSRLLKPISYQTNQHIVKLLKGYVSGRCDIPDIFICVGNLVFSIRSLDARCIVSVNVSVRRAAFLSLKSNGKWSRKPMKDLPKHKWLTYTSNFSWQECFIEAYSL